MGRNALSRVDWSLPGMENYSQNQVKTLKLLIKNQTIVYSIHCLGWSFWPTSNKGYYDERLLRLIADFIETQNKPFLDEYEEHCRNIDYISLDDLDFGDM